MVKKFIEKKKSAKFQLRPRDTANPNCSGRDSVFVRVDRNDYSVDAFSDWENDDAGCKITVEPDCSIFSDAIDDTDGEEEGEVFNCGELMVGLPVGLGPGGGGGGRGAIPEEVRREILELGFPDDGYNYMVHLREIKKAGSGSTFYHNSKAKMTPLPFDFKAFDASGLKIREVGVDQGGTPICSLADRTTGLRRLPKAVDPEVAALLDADGSDAEEIDEDFVVLANINESPERETVTVNPAFGSGSGRLDVGAPLCSDVAEAGKCQGFRGLLDERLDQLLLVEYGGGRDDFDVVPTGVEDLRDVFRGRPEEEGAAAGAEEYRAPADVMKEGGRRRDDAGVEYAAALMRVCAEYAERYQGGEGEEMATVEESGSDEGSEAWDCETIVSTYSNLDNHPGRIGAPGAAGRRKKPPAEAEGEVRPIALRGRHMIPAGFSSAAGRKDPAAGRRKEKKEGDRLMEEMVRKRQEGMESKEEKKERKAAVKAGRREARRVKKEVKGLYQYEAQVTRRVLASLPPPSIRIA